MRKLDVIDAEIKKHQNILKKLNLERDEALRNLTVINPRVVSHTGGIILGV
ncbi:hypothetical protein [Winogradskyella sp.]|uniref:hypothetical protein n=1 Tax=Winogradskyella sp. TaxID=1883156 RepID=UPI003BAD4DE6